VIVMRPVAMAAFDATIARAAFVPPRPAIRTLPSIPAPFCSAWSPEGS